MEASLLLTDRHRPRLCPVTTVFRVVILELLWVVDAALEVIVSRGGVLGRELRFRRVIFLLGLKEVFHQAIDESRGRPFVS